MCTDNYICIFKTEDMEFKTTKERILKAASKCDEAKKVLKELYPEAFEDEKYEDRYFNLYHLKEHPFTKEESIAAGFNNRRFFQVSDSGNYRNKGFYLSNKYNWDKVIDDEGQEILVPTKKN